MWIPAIVEWSELSENGKVEIIKAIVSGDVLDKLAIQETGNNKLLLAIIANKHTRQDTFDLLLKREDEEIRRAIYERKSAH